MKGLQSQTAAFTAKLPILPITSPPTKQKLATVAATSTSSILPFSLGLCSIDGADIMHKLEMYPFDHPKIKRINMYKKSEFITGDNATVDAGRCTLHKRKRGINSVRAMDSVRRRFADQMSNEGNEQAYRPKRSPMLKTRK